MTPERYAEWVRIYNEHSPLRASIYRYGLIAGVRLALLERTWPMRYRLAQRKAKKAKRVRKV